jgi:hypothetical protein
MGLVNAFKDYIPNFAIQQKLFSGMSSNTKKFAWGPEQEKGFATIKKAVAEVADRYHVTYQHPLALQVDASDDGIGGVLLQYIHPDLKPQPILYMSQAFSDVARRWSTIEQEAYAIYYCIMKCESILLGYHFTIMTDHMNLIYIYKATAPKVVRWKLRLQIFDFDIVHIPGTANAIADTLSRLFTMNSNHTELVKSNHNVRKRPPNEKCIQIMHNCMVGHHGITNTLDKLKAKKWTWENMHKDVADFISKCAVCQKIKHAQGSVLASLSTTIRDKLFARVAIDTIGPLPKDEYGNKYIIVMVCSFSRFVEMEPFPDSSAKSAAKAILRLVGRYGVPEEIQSDQGGQYAGDIVTDLLKLLNIDRRFTLQYHPSANGMVERQNQEVMKHLKAIVYDKGVKRDWSLYLPLVQRICNTSIHSAIGTIPARVVFGDNAYLDRGFNEGLIAKPRTQIITYEDHIQDLNEQILNIANASMTHQKKIFDLKLSKQPRNPTKFDVGTLVLVSYHDQPPDKLTTYWRGPLVIQRVDGQTYYCQNLLTLAINPYHLTRLKRFKSSEEWTKEDNLALAARDNDERPVDKISAHRGDPTIRQNMEFLVHWVGDEPGQESWEQWDIVKKLVQLDDYIKIHYDELKALAHTKKLKMLDRDRVGDAKAAKKRKRRGRPRKDGS